MSGKTKRKKGKSKKGQKTVEEIPPIETVVEVDKEAIEVWESLTNHSLKNISNKSNYLALTYGKEKNKIVVSCEDSGGPSECIEDLGAEEDAYFIVARGSRISRKEKLIRPLTLVILWIPRKFKMKGLGRGLTRTVMSFHLTYIIETLGLKDFLFIEASRPNELERKTLIESVRKITTGIHVEEHGIKPPVPEPKYDYDFSRTVQQIRKKFGTDFKYSNKPIAIPESHIFSRPLFSSFLFKEGGGTMSYSVKRRYHVLTADLKMSYFDKKVDGKKKGDYSVVAARVGHGHPEVWKKKKGIGGIFGKKKKKEDKNDELKPGCWFFIQTKKRTYCVNAESKRSSECWLRALEMCGCIREDHEKGNDFEQEGFGGRRTKSIIDFSGDIFASIKKLEKIKEGEKQEMAEKTIAENEVKVETLTTTIEDKNLRIAELEERVVDIARDRRTLRLENIELKKLCGVFVDDEEEKIHEYEYQKIEYQYQQFLNMLNGVVEEEEESGGDDEDDTSESSEDESGDEESSEDEDEEEDEEEEDVKKEVKKKKEESSEEESSGEEESEEESESDEESEEESDSD